MNQETVECLCGRTAKEFVHVLGDLVVRVCYLRR